MNVTLSDGTCAGFDLVVGAEGIHSALRAQMFGSENTFTRFLGHYTAAFIIDDPSGLSVPTDAFSMMTVPGRQVALYPIPAVGSHLFLHRDRRRLAGLDRFAAAEELRRMYGYNRVVPTILARCDPAGLYFDAVSQVVMPRWSTGHVALVGDACQCVSLLAGQGASLAIAAGDALARELTNAGRDIEAALARYEQRIRPHVDRAQQSGRSMARWFVPDGRVRLAVRDLALRLAGSAIAASLLKRVLAIASSGA